VKIYTALLTTALGFTAGPKCATVCGNSNNICRNEMAAGKIIVETSGNGSKKLFPCNTLL